MRVEITIAAPPTVDEVERQADAIVVAARSLRVKLRAITAALRTT